MNYFLFFIPHLFIYLFIFIIIFFHRLYTSPQRFHMFCWPFCWFELSRYLGQEKASSFISLQMSHDWRTARYDLTNGKRETVLISGFRNIYQPGLLLTSASLLVCRWVTSIIWFSLVLIHLVRGKQYRVGYRLAAVGFDCSVCIFHARQRDEAFNITSRMSPHVGFLHNCFGSKFWKCEGKRDKRSDKRKSQKELHDSALYDIELSELKGNREWCNVLRIMKQTNWCFDCILKQLLDDNKNYQGIELWWITQTSANSRISCYRKKCKS